MDNTAYPPGIGRVASLIQLAIDAHRKGDAAKIEKHTDRAVAYARQLLAAAPAATRLPYAPDLNRLIKELLAARDQAATKEKQLAAVTDAALSGSGAAVPLLSQLLQGPADPTNQLQSRLDGVLFTADLRPDEPAADAPAPAAAPASAIEPKPEPKTTQSVRWDADRREVSIGGKVVKTFRQQAMNQTPVLATFEKQGWPDRVKAPLRTRQIDDTVRDLNKWAKPAGLVFERDGTTEGILHKLRKNSGRTPV